MPRSLPVVQSESPWYADGLSFTCTQCGNCCTGGPGYVWMSDEEVHRLAAHLNLSLEQTVKKYIRSINGRLSLKERRDEKGQYPCVFLTETAPGKRGCGIYQARPLQCRTWPFWEGNLDSPKQWASVGKTCPGLNKGKRYTLKQIELLRDATDWPEPSKTPGSKPPRG
jgi:uncharacterized protein